MDFEVFVRSRASTFARVAFLMTGDVHLADELLQETLIRAAQRWERITRNDADPEPYVRRIMTTRSIDLWRQRRRAVDSEVADDQRLASHPSVDNSVDGLVLREALMRLTPRQRAVLVLRYFWDLTEVETAVAMGCSVSTVKSQARHAIARLHELAPDLLDDLDPRGTR